MRILFLVRSLNHGGAERQLVTLLVALRAQGRHVSLAQFYSGGPLEAELSAAGVRVHDLAKRGRWDVLRFFWRLARLVRDERPDVLHGYLPTPNLLTIAMRSVCPGIRAVWGVRASGKDLSKYDWLARVEFGLARLAARFADLVIVNSQAGLEYHVAQGFPREKMNFVPNGIDTQRFRADPVGRARLRSDWGALDTHTVVGLAARHDPVKDHVTFLQAAAVLSSNDDRWRFILVGAEDSEFTAQLRDAADGLGLHDRLVWAGPQDDMTAAYSAFDIAVSSSSSEGFSNAIAEGMACGVPCVATDVGDSALIVGEAGEVVTARDPAALAAGIKNLAERLARDKQTLRGAARGRIRQNFSVRTLVEGSAQALGSLFGQPSTDPDWHNPTSES